MENNLQLLFPLDDGSIVVVLQQLQPNSIMWIFQLTYLTNLFFFYLFNPLTQCLILLLWFDFSKKF